MVGIRIKCANYKLNIACESDEKIPADGKVTIVVDGTEMLLNKVLNDESGIKRHRKTDEVAPLKKFAVGSAVFLVACRQLGAGTLARLCVAIQLF